MTHPHFQPSVYERPVLRFRFLTPDGKTHQATLATNNPGAAALFSGLSHEANVLRIRLSSAVAQLCLATGCALRDLDLVGFQTLEIEAEQELEELANPLETRMDTGFVPLLQAPKTGFTPTLVANR